MTNLEKVDQFHKMFKLPILDEPKYPQPERCRLRIKLLEEELKEVVEAIHSGNLPEILKELCDLEYVLQGAVLEFGLGEIYDKGFDLVHSSNLSKLCHGTQDLEDSIESYRKEGVDAHGEQISDGVWILRRTSDGKVLKSINYSPAEKDIQKLF